MKFSAASLAVLALSTQHVAAFPAALSEAMIQIRSANEAQARSTGIEGGCPFKRQAEAAEAAEAAAKAKEVVKRQAKGVIPPFDAQQQYVSNQGVHAFNPPSGDDQRGPCMSSISFPLPVGTMLTSNITGPGLNAMANHGYLPHNGIGTIEDFITGTQEAFGMGQHTLFCALSLTLLNDITGVDLATFLAVYGAIFDGDLTSYSIGGPVPTLLNADGLLGAPQGLSGSHNKYEGDVSPTRGDLFE